MPEELIDNCYSVEGRPQRGNKYEYLACRLEKGAMVRYEYKRLTGEPIKGTGIFLFSTCYDGIHAVIDNGKKDHLILSLCCGDKIEVLDDPNELSLPSMWGEGI